MYSARAPSRASSGASAAVGSPSDCDCSDFWFGSEDAAQTKAIHERYMAHFQLSTTRKHASRAPIAFIGNIARRRISATAFHEIVRHFAVNARRGSPRSDSDALDCCARFERTARCASCRLYTLDEVVIVQRDAVPLGFTMKQIDEALLVSMYDNFDGLPLHQHRLSRWPVQIVDKIAVKPDSYIECQPFFDDDPTGLTSTDASFNYHCSNERDCVASLGYAAMSQTLIFDALRRLGRPTDAEAVRQLNATCKESGDQDTELAIQVPCSGVPDDAQPPHNDVGEQNDDDADDQVDGEDEVVEQDEDDDFDAVNGIDGDDTAVDDDQQEEAHDESEEAAHALAPSNTPAMRRHHTEEVYSSSSRMPRRQHGLRRARTQGRRSVEDEAAALMAKLGLLPAATQRHNENDDDNDDNDDAHCQQQQQDDDDDAECAKDEAAAAAASDGDDEACEHGW
jgi:hypothetical protein